METRYYIKRGNKTNLSKAVVKPYEPIYTKDTNELFIANQDSVPVKVTDVVIVNDLNEVENPIDNKIYVVIDSENDTAQLAIYANEHFIIASSVNNNSEDYTSSFQSAIEQLQQRLLSKAEADHTHVINDVDQLQEALDSKAPVEHTHAIEDVNHLQESLDGKADAAHTHEIQDVNGLDKELLDVNENIQLVEKEKANVEHTHKIGDIEGLADRLSNTVTGEHKHSISDILDLEETLDNKASKLHSHTIQQVSGLSDKLDALADDIHHVDATKANASHTHKWVDIDDRPTAIPTEIDSAVKDAHTHVNKNVIDRLADADGNLLYKGKSLTGYAIAVATHQDRDAIPMSVRINGMLCLVIEDGSLYYLKDGVDNAFWTIFSIGQGGAINASGLEAVPTGSLTGVNAQALIDELEKNKANLSDVYSRSEIDKLFTTKPISFSQLTGMPDLSVLHDHKNKTTLDGFGTSNGELTWNGTALIDRIMGGYDRDLDGVVDKAKTLDGLSATVDELSYVAGLTGNIQSQLDALSGGVSFKGTFADFNTMLGEIPEGKKGDWVFIQTDEMHDNAPNTQYFHDGTTWVYGGGASSIPESTQDILGGIKLGGVLANPKSTAAAPLLNLTGVTKGTYTSPTITVDEDGRISNASSNELVLVDDENTEGDTTWSSQKISDELDKRSYKNHTHDLLHDPHLLGHVTLAEDTPTNNEAIVYNALTGQAEWQKQQGGRVYVGSKYVEGDYSIQAGSHISLFIDDVTKTITINSTFQEGVENGVATLTEITESFVVPAGESVRLSSNAAFNKYMIHTIICKNPDNQNMELRLYETSEGDDSVYVSNRTNDINDLMSLPYMDKDQNKMLHFGVQNYGVMDTTVTLVVKTTNLI